MARSGRFLTDLIVRELDDDRKELVAPLVYHAEDGQRFLVPAGFVTDYASIPWFVRWRFPKSGPWKWGATLHDYLYQHNGVTRARADALFNEGMAAKDVSWRARQTLYWGVRTGGRLTWKRYRHAERETT